MFTNSKARNIKFESDVCDCSCTVFQNGKPNNRYGQNMEQDSSQSNPTHYNETSTTHKKKISLADMHKKKKTPKESNLRDRHDESTKDAKRLLSESTSSIKMETAMGKLDSAITTNSIPSELRLSLQDIYRPRILNPQGYQPYKMVKRQPLGQVCKQPPNCSNPYNQSRHLKVPLIYPCSFQNSQRSGEVTFAPSSLAHSLDLQSHHQLKQAISTQRKVENMGRQSRQINVQMRWNQENAVNTIQLTDTKNKGTRTNANSPQNKIIVNTHPRHKVVIPKEVQSRYEGTIQRADQDKSSKGKTGQMRFKNIVSMPGSDYLGQEPDSIIVDHFTPIPGSNIIAPHIQNRFSQPPLLSHDEMEFLRNLTGKEVSAFQLNTNLQFSSKTQR